MEAVETEQLKPEDKSFDFESDARDALYKKAEALDKDAELKEQPETDTDAPADTGDETPDTSPEAEETAEPDKEEYEPEDKEDPDKAEKKKPEEKTVSLKALREARGKQKVLRQEVTDLKDKLSQVLRDYKTLAETRAQGPREEEYGYDEAQSDPEVLKIKKEVDDLKKIAGQYVEREEMTRAEKEQKELNAQIIQADAELEAKGLPGLKWAMGAVVQEIKHRVKQNPEEAWLYSPEGWAEVYEDIYPEIEASFVKKDKDQIMEDKKLLKSKANLVTSPGKDEAKPKSDDRKTEKEMWDDYIADRRKRFGVITGVP